MKNNLNNSELISRYFEGRFSEDELRWFNRKLAEDRDLAAEFRLYLEIDKAIEYKDVWSLRNQLDILHEKINGMETDTIDLEAKLNEEIDRAIMEEDVMNLRSKLDKLDNLNSDETKPEIEHYTSELSEELSFFDDIDNAINEPGIEELKQKLESIHYEVEHEMFSPKKALDNNVLSYEIDEALSQKDIFGLRNNLDNIHQELHDEEKSSADIPVIKFMSREKSRFTPLRLASSFAILIVGALISFMIFSGSKSPSDIYSTYYHHELISTGDVRSDESNSELNANINAAKIAYNNQDFILAAENFQKSYESGKIENNDKMYYAIALKENGMTEKAVNIFNEIIYGKECSNQEPSIWQLAGTYFKNGEYELARKQYEKLAAEEEAFKYDEARKMLKMIKRE